VLNGENYEITTYRIDGEYLDSRHPESVEFTTELSEDLSRRDFTMNALCYNPKQGITDLHGGKSDIGARLIRAVGDPEMRFTEDALRIIRGIRFAAVLGFDIEEKTAAAMEKCAHLLSNVSSERIFTEWKKLISGDYAYPIIDKYRNVIKVFLPEVAHTPLPNRERFDSSDPLPRMISLFKSAGGEKYRAAMARLKTDSQTRDAGFLTLTSMKNYDTSSRLGIKILMSELGAEIASLRLKVEYILGIREHEETSLVENILKAREPYMVSELDINGSDLISLGIKGPKIGQVMRKLLRLVMEDKLKNARSDLIAHVKKHLE
jgi:tRNA nucleotidyltransferase (CCA-adding enzyme)